MPKHPSSPVFWMPLAPPMELADNNDSVPYFVVWSVFETERNRGLATVEKPVDENSVVVYEKNVSMNKFPFQSGLPFLRFLSSDLFPTLVAHKDNFSTSSPLRMFPQHYFFSQIMWTFRKCRLGISFFSSYVLMKLQYGKRTVNKSKWGWMEDNNYSFAVGETKRVPCHCSPFNAKYTRWKDKNGSWFLICQI